MSAVRARVPTSGPGAQGVRATRGAGERAAARAGQAAAWAVREWSAGRWLSGLMARARGLGRGEEKVAWRWA